MKIEKLLAPGEMIIYRSRFGVMRYVADLFALALAILVGSFFGSASILLLLGMIILLIQEHRKKVIVTNQRVIYMHRALSGFRVDEINLGKIEGIRNSGQRMTIVGSGGTRLKLPNFLVDQAGLGNAIRNGAMHPLAS